MSKYHRRINLFEKRKKATNVVLRVRDFNILRFLFENKVVSRDQINQRFFPGASKDAVNKRLRKIMSLSLIRRKPITVGHRVIYGYSLTRCGLDEIKPMLGYEVKTSSVQSECPRHDLALNDIRRKFESKGAVQSYYTENVLQTSTELQRERKFQPFIALNSDAMAEIDSKVGVLNLAIEFDTTPKSKSRYSKKVHEYYVEQGVDGVLYICVNKYILHALQKVDQEMSDRYRCASKVYFALLDDVIDTDNEMLFRSANDYIFRVR